MIVKVMIVMLTVMTDNVWFDEISNKNNGHHLSCTFTISKNKKTSFLLIIPIAFFQKLFLRGF